MRCARCDHVAMPQVLARRPDGTLVFGWCADCLEDQGCEVVDVEPATLVVSPRRVPIARRVRHVGVTIRRWQRRPRTLEASRRLATLGLAGLMAAWALVLAFVGGLKMIVATDNQGMLLLSGSGLMAMVSLGVWVSVIARGDRRGMVLKLVQVAAVVVALGTIAWGIVRRRSGGWSGIAGVVAAGVAVAMVATILQRRPPTPRTRPSPTGRIAS